jgi:hypothetical protein
VKIKESRSFETSLNITQRYTASLAERYESSGSDCFKTAVQTMCRADRQTDGTKRANWTVRVAEWQSAPYSHVLTVRLQYSQAQHR